MLTTGGTLVSHDARGNTTAIGSSTFGYDSQNRMTSAGNVAFGYDPLGRLSYSTGDPHLTRFAYDGASLISEHDYDWGTLRRYVHGPGVDEPLVAYEGSGTSQRRFLHADERGSIIARSDDNGNVTAINRYDEYGVPATTNVGRLQYTGQMWMPEIGMYHFRMRVYNPNIPGGRFMQLDPTWPDDGPNGYTYPRNDPVNLNDPFGLFGATRIAPPHRDAPPPEDAEAIVTGMRCRGTCYTEAKWGHVSSVLDIGGSGPPLGLGWEAQQIVVTGVRRRQKPQVEARSLDAYSMFNHWVNGRGETICLTSVQFSRMLQIGRIGNVPRGADRAPIDFYGTQLENSFGIATLFLRNGRPSGFYDRYDMGRASHRGTSAENRTTAGRVIGGILGATDYDVRYPC